MTERRTECEHYLIVRLAAVGDVVMASTLARRIRDERPGARITWLCGTKVAPLVEQFADVDDVISIDERRLLRGGPIARTAELVPLWRQLLKCRFTRVMLLHVDRRYRVVTAPLLATPTISLSARDAHGAMNPIPGRYFGDEYARLLDGLGHEGPIHDHYPLARLRPFAVASASERVAPRVAIVPGGARNVMRESGVRRWPVEHYSRVARELVADGVEVTLVGDGADAWVRPSFDGITVDDRIGSTSLPETVALMSASDLVISHDTGPMHLARLANAKLLALFGPTMPTQFVVESDRTTVLWGGAHLPCRPCYDGREFATCRDNVCMTSIDPAVVLATARTLLNRG
jgi:ADP-heptose:LPS heptosyltransferase